jgi:hypothetical protein
LNRTSNRPPRPQRSSSRPAAVFRVIRQSPASEEALIRAAYRQELESKSKGKRVLSAKEETEERLEKDPLATLKEAFAKVEGRWDDTSRRRRIVNEARRQAHGENHQGE